MSRARQCVCGGWIAADERNPGPAVLEHRRTSQHIAWTGVRHRPCPGTASPCASIIPLGMDLCAGCRGTLRLLVAHGGSGGVDWSQSGTEPGEAQEA